MSRKWQLQDAKAKLSEVVTRAQTEGPQIVTYRGVDRAVVLSIEEYRRLEANRPSLLDYLMAGPKLDDDAIASINDRSRDTGRTVDL
ncbi:MAG: type II toxin-antitoxin system Phd/YefM family antitoxin [Rhodospirillales bacterium]|nr:type II toxin-antitoxin system Phd/YefM family antitoxin [Rhodospirillales bacterium]